MIRQVQQDLTPVLATSVDEPAFVAQTRPESVSPGRSKRPVSIKSPSSYSQLPASLSVDTEARQMLETSAAPLSDGKLAMLPSPRSPKSSSGLVTATQHELSRSEPASQLVDCILQDRDETVKARTWHGALSGFLEAIACASDFSGNSSEMSRRRRGEKEILSATPDTPVKQTPRGRSSISRDTFSSDGVLGARDRVSCDQNCAIKSLGNKNDLSSTPNYGLQVGGNGRIPSVTAPLSASSYSTDQPDATACC